MSMSMKQIFGAALLAAAVVGGSATYLNSSLNTTKAVVAYDGLVTEHQASIDRHPEVIVTEGRAS